MTVSEILERMDARREHADRVSNALADVSSPVRKLSEAKRGNASEVVNPSDVDKVFAMTLMEEISRTKASVKRFAS